MAADTVAVDTAAVAETGRVALVAGATGLVGREVLAALLTDRTYARVHCIGRRNLPLQHPKLVQHTVDFSTLKSVPKADDVFIALGTTIKVAGSQSAFRAIDFEAVEAVAVAAHARGASRLGVVSAMGANAGSTIFYNRVKGEMEDALAKIGFTSLVIVRPSMLAGNREALDQPQRLGERIALLASRTLKPLIPANYRSVVACDVAHALVKAVKSAQPGVRCMLSGELQGAANG